MYGTNFFYFFYLLFFLNDKNIDSKISHDPSQVWSMDFDLLFVSTSCRGNLASSLSLVGASSRRHIGMCFIWGGEGGLQEVGLHLLVCLFLLLHLKVFYRGWRDS